MPITDIAVTDIADFADGHAFGTAGAYVRIKGVARGMLALNVRPANPLPQLVAWTERSEIPKRSASLKRRSWISLCSIYLPQRTGLGLPIRTLRRLVRKINHPDVFGYAHADYFPSRRQHVFAMA